MFKGLPFKHLPVPAPRNRSRRLSFPITKIALGVVLLTFLSGYQPTFDFPPITKNIAYAQEPDQTITAKTLPFPFNLPHPGYISTKYSHYHPGVDIAAGYGMPINPVAKGVVVNQGYNFWGLGLTVTVQHPDGYQSLYAHMGKIYVKKGQEVDTTDKLGTVGLTGNTTGPHTHLEIQKEGNYLDPQTILPTLQEYPTENYISYSNPNQKKTNEAPSR